MINREILTVTITVRGDVLRHQTVSKAKIIQEFLKRELHAVDKMGYGAKICPIPCCSLEALPIFYYHQLLLSIQLCHIPHLTRLSSSCNLPVYKLPMAYVVEAGNF